MCWAGPGDGEEDDQEESEARQHEDKHKQSPCNARDDHQPQDRWGILRRIVQEDEIASKSKSCEDRKAQVR